MMHTHASRLLWTLLAGLILAGSVRAQIYADFQTTKGAFTVELFHQDVPRTVANFVTLVEGTRPWTDPRTNQVPMGVPFYDGLTFHRVSESFVIQGGSPKGDGSDGPGYKFPDELVKDAAGQLRHPHVPGVISMANSGVHTNGSQFFVTTATSSTAGLNDKHTVFGQVTDGPFGSRADGMAVVSAIGAAPGTPIVGSDGLPDGTRRPDPPMRMQTVRIRRVGASAIAFDPLAWQLPTVGGDAHAAPTFVPGVPGPITEIELAHPALIHRAYLYEESIDLATWTRIQVSGRPVSLIHTQSMPFTFTYWGLDGIDEQYLRAREIDYSPLIAQTYQPLSASASLRLKFTSPVLELTLTRVGAGGTWAVTGPPASSGQLASISYPLPNGDAGFFSPVLGSTMTNPMPWTIGVTLRNLYLLLTFDVGSTTAGYFFSEANTNATPSVLVRGKGVFSVLVP